MKGQKRAEFGINKVLMRKKRQHDLVVPNLGHNNNVIK